MITEAQLRQIMPNLPLAKLQQYLPFLNAAMHAMDIGNLLRTAAFVAQLAHESGEFRWMEEIWGPTAQQKRYDPPDPLAARLGNTQPGDGKRFKGHGPIQITGRFNHKKYGDLLGIDLTTSPERAALPEVAFLTAGLFWKTNRLNELADGEQFTTITRRINGGTTGLPDRQKYYAKAKAVLAAGFVAGSGAPASRGAERAAPMTLPAEPLTRGFEAIAAAAPAKKAAAKNAPAKAPAAKKTPAAKAATAKKVPAAKKSPVTAAPAKKVAVKKAAVKKVAVKQSA